jgi:hypothetical protein
MWRSGLSARLDRHLDRGEQLMAENQAASERNTAAFEGLMEAFDRHEKAFDRHDLAMAKHEKAMEKHEDVMDRVIAALERHEAREDDLKIFLREQTLRSEKVIREMLRRNEAFNAEQSARTDAITSRLEEVTKEQRAQREALLRLIDRFPPPAEAA